MTVEILDDSTIAIIFSTYSMFKLIARWISKTANLRVQSVERSLYLFRYKMDATALHMVGCASEFYDFFSESSRRETSTFSFLVRARRPVSSKATPISLGVPGNTRSLRSNH